MQYTHLLIPEAPTFVPEPARVMAFFEDLEKIGAAPLKPKIRVMTLSGEVRKGMNPLTGEMMSVPRRRGATIQDNASISRSLGGLLDYSVFVEGSGPALHEPLRLHNRGLQFTEAYSYSASAHLRETVVSMSSWSGDIPGHPKPLEPGQPIESATRMGFFQNPHTGLIIEVPNAGYAKFWIEFEFGKFLFPQIEDHLDILAPAVVELAASCFGVGFLQGCAVR